MRILEIKGIVFYPKPFYLAPWTGKARRSV